MIKIVAVEYLNTLPYIKAIESSELLRGKIKLERSNPRHCADALINGSADLVLLPIGALSNFDNLYCQLKFGIACEGEVGTVGIFSDKLWNDIHIVKESASSRSSNLLLHTLNKYYWNHQLKIVETNSNIDCDASLIIGDDSFHAKKLYQHYYDLGLQWKFFSNRPFLFALWLSKRPLPSEILYELNTVFNFFTDAKQLKILEENITDYPIENYLTRQIQFKIDFNHIESLDYFLKINKIKNPIHFLE